MVTRGFGKIINCVPRNSYVGYEAPLPAAAQARESGGNEAHSARLLHEAHNSSSTLILVEH